MHALSVMKVNTFVIINALINVQHFITILMDICVKVVILHVMNVKDLILINVKNVHLEHSYIMDSVNQVVKMDIMEIVSLFHANPVMKHVHLALKEV